MIILVDGEPAVLKQGSSFDFVAENRLFLGRDSYTLNLIFPLRGCPQNQKVFGLVARMDMPKVNSIYKCEIRDKSFSARGSLIVTGGSEVEITCQFAEGQCEATAKDPFEEVFINEMNLGVPPSGSFTPEEAWVGIDDGMDAVALPWINESYPTVSNNWVKYEDGHYKWITQSAGDRYGVDAFHDALYANRLSWQPYLLVLAKRICGEIGYTFDFSEWENSPYKYLLACNTLPASWDEEGFAAALPNWTVTEFFQKLGLLLMGEFNIDHAASHIGFEFSKNALEKIAPEKIENVVDNYDFEISSDDTGCEYIGAKRLAYKECSHSLQSLYACDWYMPNAQVRRYANAHDLVEANAPRYVASTMPGWNGTYIPIYGDPPREGESLIADGYGRLDYDSYTRYVLFAEAESTYFIFHCIGRMKIGEDGRGNDVFCRILTIQPLNVFGSGCPESDEVQTEEIEFVPACVADTYVSESDDQGYMLYLPAPNSNEDGDPIDGDSLSFAESLMEQSKAKGSKGKKEYYDVIYVAFWDGTIPERGKTPYPLVDPVVVTQDFHTFNAHVGNLRLYGEKRSFYKDLPLVDPKQKFKFSFVSDTIPNPRAIFHIGGRRYVCEKITATFTENGMSQLLKGEFYPVVD